MVIPYSVKKTVLSFLTEYRIYFFIAGGVIALWLAVQAILSRRAEHSEKAYALHERMGRITQLFSNAVCRIIGLAALLCVLAAAGYIAYKIIGFALSQL